MSAYWSPNAPCSRARIVVGSPRNRASVLKMTWGRRLSCTSVSFWHSTGAVSTHWPLSGGGLTSRKHQQREKRRGVPAIERRRNLPLNDTVEA
jgi:hypothetical protein